MHDFSFSSNKVQATVVDYRTGACGAKKTISNFIYKLQGVTKNIQYQVSDGGGLDLGLEAVDRGSYDCL